MKKFVIVSSTMIDGYLNSNVENSLIEENEVNETIMNVAKRVYNEIFETNCWIEMGSIIEYEGKPTIFIFDEDQNTIAKISAFNIN